jgi:hypothetical protein
VSEKPFTITGIDSSGFLVADSARAVAFYRDVLWLEPARVYPEDRSLGRRRRREAVPTEPPPPSRRAGFRSSCGVKRRFAFLAMIKDTERNTITFRKRKRQ